MSVKSLMDSSRNIELLKYYYLERRLSTTEISKISKDIFGFVASTSTIYNAIIRNNINIRSKSESVSIAKQVLNPETSYITEPLIEWIDGFLLGDGYIGINKELTDLKKDYEDLETKYDKKVEDLKTNISIEKKERSNFETVIKTSVKSFKLFISIIVGLFGFIAVLMKVLPGIIQLFN